MQSRIIEAGNNFNWGKFLIARFTEEEWKVRSAVPMKESPLGSVLRERGWHPRHIIVFDLETCEGAAFSPGGLASADLQKHRVWVCPMFEPFLEWLYDQDLSDFDALPPYVELEAPSALAGYRRPGFGFPLNSGFYEV